jgi:surface carbohydrate biosynthesis protein
MKKVSLILDNPIRDINYIVLIAMHLAKNNCEVTIVPTNMRHYELLHTEPDYVLYPHQRHQSSLEICILEDLGIDIGVLETEQHVSDSYYLNYQTPKDKNLLKNTLHMFSWGYNFADLLKNKNLYTDNQIQVVGNPRFDSYFFESKKLREKETKLLIGTGFGIANPKFLSKKQQKKAFLNENMSEDDYLRYQDVHQNCFDMLIELLSSNFFTSKDHIELRPHPYEDEKIYKKKLKNIKVDNSKTLDKQLLTTESYLHYHSTSSIDAAVLKVPSINLDWFPIFQRLHSSTRFMEKISYQPSSLTELKDLKDQISDSRLKPKLNLDDRIFEEFFYKIDGKSHELISEKILEINNKINKKNIINFPQPFNNLRSPEFAIKFMYTKKKWAKSGKKYGVSEISSTINYLNKLLGSNEKFNIEEVFVGKLKLGTVRVTK